MRKHKKTCDVRYTLQAKTAFCFIEVVAALTILVFLAVSVLTVYDRCMTAAADSALKMNAFEVARENMENLLILDSAELKVEYGQSEIYPDITWQTTVETFYEPMTAKIWLQATCSAQYFDTAGIEQSIELKHWLTELSNEDVAKVFDSNDPNDPNNPLASEPDETDVPDSNSPE